MVTWSNSLAALALKCLLAALTFDAIAALLATNHRWNSDVDETLDLNLSILGQLETRRQTLEGDHGDIPENTTIRRL